MKEPIRPVRRQVEDFKCCDFCKNFDYEQDCCFCDCCDDIDNCEYPYNEGISRKDEITLRELIRTYEGCNPDDIVITIDYDYDNDVNYIVILRPENEAEFLPKMLDYEEKMKKYDAWVKKNPPEKLAKEKAAKKKLAAEKKLQQIEAERQKEIDKLKAKIKELEKE